MDGFPPYLLGNSGYPLLPWLMTPHRNVRNPTVLESLYNRKLRRGRVVVENAFGILKQSWRELLHKIELEVTYLPDVITACVLLHNFLLRQASDDVNRLLGVLHAEGWRQNTEDVNHNVVVNEGGEDVEVGQRLLGAELQQALGVHLGALRGLL